MKKICFLLILIFLAGCSGVVTNGGRELTLEQVQQYARQTMTAQAGSGGSSAGSQDTGSGGGLLIRPVQQSTQPASSASSSSPSGLTVVSTPDTTGIISRPVIDIPTTVPNAVPTAAPGIQRPLYTEPTSTPYYAQQVSTVCERIRFIDDVTVPDDTVMAPGQRFRKTWRIQNGGSCAWNAGYQLIFTGGDAMGTNYAVNLPGAVAPGETVDISVDLTAPNSYGTFQSNWNLRSPSGNVFGTSNPENNAIWAKIVVATNANMSTVAPDITPVNSSCTLLSVIPAYRAPFKPGEETDFYFRVRNNTYTVWKADDLDIAYISGENMLKRKDQTRRDMPYSVNPGGTLDYYLDAVVPDYPGTYTMTMGIVRGYEVLCSMDVTLTVTY